MCDLQLCLKIQFHHSLHERWMFQPYSKKMLLPSPQRFPLKKKKKIEKIKKKRYTGLSKIDNLCGKLAVIFFSWHSLVLLFFFLFSSRKWNGSRTWFTNGDYGEMLEMSCLSGAKAENDRIVNENGVWCCCLYCRAEN